jgi:hypothetical protein
MSDQLAETANLGRIICPTCEPEADEMREILIIHYCQFHAPSESGTADDALRELGSLSGATESEGATNKAWGDWLRSRR